MNQVRERCYSECDFIVGVHIRKGDYARFNSGKWYYSNDDYYNFMMQILAFPKLKSRQVGFLLCSDEKIPPDDFKHVKTFISNNNFIEDLHSLAFCDLIIGPTSTFSAWASFYGQKPLIHVTDKNMKITQQLFGENE